MAATFGQFPAIFRFSAALPRPLTERLAGPLTARLGLSQSAL